MPPSLPRVSPGAVPGRAARVRFRRALTLLAMTVVAPGSAQLAAGNRTVGRWALRVYAAALACVAALLLTLLASHDEIIRLFTTVWFLGLLRFALLAYAVGWALLLIDAWRLASPLSLRQGHRLAMTAINGAVCLSLTGAVLYASHLVAIQRDFIQTVFTSHKVTKSTDGRYNILLLGGDAGRGRVGLRPDSITLASIDAKTGRTVLFGLPRNLADVPFPPGTVMNRQFPNGFDCVEECYLNAVNTWAATHPKLFPGVKDPGILATMQAVHQITGLRINYYVLVDMGGFEELVNALGGIPMNVHQEIPIGSVNGPVSGVIKPGRQVLSGYQALWYSRSRAWSSDYSRMARQKCLMNAMLHELNPETVLRKFSSLAKAGKDTLRTSIPASEIDRFVDLALKSRKLPVRSVSFVPPKIDTGNANWALIRTMVHTAIATSVKEGLSTSPGHPARQPNLGDKDSYRHHYAANDTSDLSDSC